MFAGAGFCGGAESDAGGSEVGGLGFVLVLVGLVDIFEEQGSGVY